MEERRISAPKKEGGGSNTSSFLPLAGMFAVGAVFILAFIFWPRPAPVEALTPTITAEQPTAVPASPYIALIEAHISKGEYREAQSVAQGALNVAGLREDERTLLNGYVVSLGLKTIESTIFEPLDKTQHQQLIDTYLSLHERARLTGVSLDSPLAVARKAHASSQHPLGKVAIEEAYKDKAFDPKLDRDITRLYVSLLYGMGEWYTKAEKGSALYNEGLRALVASDEIADHYQTGQSEAEALLKSLGHTDEKRWPEPLDTPLLP